MMMVVDVVCVKQFCVIDMRDNTLPWLQKHAQQIESCPFVGILLSRV